MVDALPSCPSAQQGRPYSWMNPLVEQFSLDVLMIGYQLRHHCGKQ